MTEQTHVSAWAETPARDNSTSPLMTVPEVAAHLGLSKPFVWKLVGTGAIPSIKIGSARRIIRADLDTWVASIRAGQVDGSALSARGEGE